MSPSGGGSRTSTDISIRDSNEYKLNGKGAETHLFFCFSRKIFYIKQCKDGTDAGEPMLVQGGTSLANIAK